MIINELRCFLMERKIISSVMVEKWAIDRGGVTADYARRAVRRMVEHGELEALNLAQKLSMGLVKSYGKEIAWYRIIN